MTSGETKKQRFERNMEEYCRARVRLVMSMMLDEVIQTVWDSVSDSDLDQVGERSKSRKETIAK